MRSSRLQKPAKRTATGLRPKATTRIGTWLSKASVRLYGNGSPYEVRREYRCRQTRRSADSRERTSVSKLPNHIQRFFWDVDPLQLDVDLYSRYVLERLLELGDLGAVRWMLAYFPPQEIIRVLKTSRRLSPLSANF